MNRLHLILPIVLLSVPAGAQFGARQRLSGLIAPTPPQADTLQVEATHQESRSISGRASVHYDGTFEFSRLESGHYEFRLTTRTGNVLATTMASVPNHSEIRFDLPPSPRPQSPVSIHRLTHHPPRKAIKALRQASMPTIKAATKRPPNASNPPSPPTPASPMPSTSAASSP